MGFSLFYEISLPAELRSLRYTHPPRTRRTDSTVGRRHRRPSPAVLDGENKYHETIFGLQVLFTKR